MDKTGLKKFIFMLAKIYLLLFSFMIPFLIIICIFVGLSNNSLNLWMVLTFVFSPAIGIFLLFLFIGIIGFLVYLYNSFVKKRKYH